MRDDVQERMHRSMQAVTVTAHQWARPLAGVTRLYPVEGDRHPVLQLLDRAGFVDYYGQRPDGTLIRIAMRAQFAPLLYASHTIREERVTGSRTEWAKLQHAYSVSPSLLPEQHIQIYVSDDGAEFIGGASIASPAFVAWLTGNWQHLERRTSPELFMVAWWADMRAAGVPVTALGEDQLRGPAAARKASVYRYFNREIVYGPCPECGYATAIGFKGEPGYPQPTRCTNCRARQFSALTARDPR